MRLLDFVSLLAVARAAHGVVVLESVGSTFTARVDVVLSHENELALIRDGVEVHVRRNGLVLSFQDEDGALDAAGDARHTLGFEELDPITVAELVAVRKLVTTLHRRCRASLENGGGVISRELDHGKIVS